MAEPLQFDPEIIQNAHNGTVIWDNDDAGYDEMMIIEWIIT